MVTSRLSPATVTCAATGASVLLCTIAAASKRSPRSAKRGMIGSSISGRVTTKLDSDVPPPPLSSSTTAVMRNSVRLSGSLTFVFTRPSPSVTRSGSQGAVSTKFLRVSSDSSPSLSPSPAVWAFSRRRSIDVAAVSDVEVERAPGAQRGHRIVRVVRGHAEDALVDDGERDVRVLHGVPFFLTSMVISASSRIS